MNDTARAQAAVQKADTARRRLEIATKPFAAARVGDAASAGYLIANILHASTEYSITGKSLDGTALLRNEGARVPYGYQPEEVVGKPIPPHSARTRGCAGGQAAR